LDIVLPEFFASVTISSFWNVIVNIDIEIIKGNQEKSQINSDLAYRKRMLFHPDTNIRQLADKSRMI
jgi:hypothetical protein